MGCNITVFYTNEDNGIHLGCSCGWERALGFRPDLTLMEAAARQHYLDASS